MNARLPVAGLAALTVPVVVSRLYQWRNRMWGATAAEQAMPLPGDDLLPVSGPPTTMAITIDAPPEAVWPWLVQMGVDRAGLYTHTWVENGIFRLGVRNADRIVPAWQDLEVGDRIAFMRSTPGREGFGPLVAAMEPHRALILAIGVDVATAFSAWQFVLQPTPAGGTRLLLRSRANPRRPLGVRLFDYLFEAGYTYMDIGMLRGIGQRAERASRGVPVGSPRVLVAVTSSDEGVREVGEALAQGLRHEGLDAVVRDVGELQGIDEEDVVILGSGIRAHHWLQPAVGFIGRFEEGLRRRPVWLFSVDALAGEAAWPEGYPEDLPVLLQETGARGHRHFPGIGAAGSRGKRWRRGGERVPDRAAIRAWARDVASSLRQEGGPSLAGAASATG